MARVKKLIQDLQSDDPHTRYEAAKDLGDKADPKAVDPLIAALDDSFDLSRRFAARALGSIGDARAAPALIKQATTHEDPGSRSTAAAALGDLGDVSAVDALIGALSDDNATVRAMGAQSLGNLRDRRATAPLLERLHDSEYGVRGETIEALGKIGDPDAVEPLADYYWETEGDRRFVAKDVWELACAAWKDRGELKEMVLFLKMDTTDEPIVKSITGALESIESGTR